VVAQENSSHRKEKAVLIMLDLFSLFPSIPYTEFVSYHYPEGIEKCFSSVIVNSRI
jgi:hypothetical protein